MTRSGVYIFSLLFISALTVLSAGTLQAIQTTFTVSANVINADTSAPSVPANLNAAAVSSSQIDLSWNASTDNVGVVGYRIYREGAFIATSSAPFYSDIGLFPSTLYSYTVDAFDGSFNFSAKSATSSATTMPEPTNTPSNNHRNPSSRRTEENSISTDIHAFPDTDSAIISWSTPVYTRATVYWGQTTDYEIGTISGVIFQKDHVVKIENLVPDTEYFYRIELESNDGSINVFAGSFKTAKDQTVLPPQSGALVAKASDKAIHLSWNSNMEDSEQVRIVRSDKFFPVDPYDGKVIYQGTREHEFDDTAVQEGVTYYYALFVIDQNESYSAPSVAKAAVGKGEKPVFSEVPYSPVYESLLKDLDLTDFNFIQRGAKLSFSGGGLNLFPDAPTEIVLDAAKIPLGIKAIGVTFTPARSGGEPVTFLLAYSKERDIYVGIVPPLESDQTYEIEINVFDSLNEKVKTIHLAAHVDAHIQSLPAANIFLGIISFVQDHLIATIVLLLLGFIIGFMARRL